MHVWIQEFTPKNPSSGVKSRQCCSGDHLTYCADRSESGSYRSTPQSSIALSSAAAARAAFPPREAGHARQPSSEQYDEDGFLLDSDAPSSPQVNLRRPFLFFVVSFKTQAGVPLFSSRLQTSQAWKGKPSLEGFSQSRCKAVPAIVTVRLGSMV